MNGDNFPPRRGSQHLPSDDDGPPPRKKVSRFFPGGKSLVGDPLSTNGKPRSANENPTPLIEDEAYTSLPQSEVSNTTALPSKNKVSETATALKKLTVRDRRRDGIIGMGSLLQQGTNMSSTSQATTHAGGSFVFGQPTSPFPRTRSFISSDGRRIPMTPEDVVRFQAAYGNANYIPPNLPRPQERRGQLDEVEERDSRYDPRPPSDLLSRSHSIEPEDLHRRNLRLQVQEDDGPLNASPPHVKASKISLNDNAFKQPFLRRKRPTGVDLDRDVFGKKLPAKDLRPILDIINKGITSLPRHATLTPSRRNISAPPTLYTSPGRIQNAILTSRKRKRMPFILPPPAFTYQRTNSPDFNIFAGFLLYPELVYHLASLLPLRDLISLYAISRDFHTIIDMRFTTVVLSQSLRKAPESSRAFPFRCYKYLCRADPAGRIPHPNPAAAAAGHVRGVPSFRWLAFVLHREKVVHELMALFAEDGVPLPARCALAIKRLWFILDIPDNARRIGFIHNVHLFTDLDLYFAMCFFVKLDMRLNDPVGQLKRDGMRKMLLAQQSFTTLLKVLRRDAWLTQMDVMTAWIRYKYEPLPDEHGMSIFGVPFEEVGKLRWEYWGKPPERLNSAPAWLLRPDQLVMREAIRRGLRFQKHFLRCLTYGYVRMDTLEDYEPRKMSRRKESLMDEYGVDDEIGGLTWSMEKAGLEDGKDGEMLDLGERKKVSLLCIEGGNRSMISREDKLKMQEQEQFLGACMAWSEAEREKGDVDAKTLLG